MPPKALTVEMQRTWWEYAWLAAVDQKIDAAVYAMRGPLKAPCDPRDPVTVPLPENAALGLLAAVERRKWGRTAEALRAGIQQAQTGETGCTQTGTRQNSGSTPSNGTRCDSKRSGKTSTVSAAGSTPYKPRSNGSLRRSESRPTSASTRQERTPTPLTTSTKIAPRSGKPKPDPLSEMREALRLMYEAGELSDDEIKAAKAKGML